MRVRDLQVLDVHSPSLVDGDTREMVWWGLSCVCRLHHASATQLSQGFKRKHLEQYNNILLTTGFMAYTHAVQAASYQQTSNLAVLCVEHKGRAS